MTGHLQAPHQISEKTILNSYLSLAYKNAVEFVYHGHLGTNQNCPDYQVDLIFQVSLYAKGPLWDLN